jgi:hypothetical protein
MTETTASVALKFSNLVAAANQKRELDTRQIACDVIGEPDEHEQRDLLRTLIYGKLAELITVDLLLDEENTDSWAAIKQMAVILADAIQRQGSQEHEALARLVETELCPF